MYLQRNAGPRFLENGFTISQTKNRNRLQIQFIHQIHSLTHTLQKSKYVHKLHSSSFSPSGSLFSLLHLCGAPPRSHDTTPGHGLDLRPQFNEKTPQEKENKIEIRGPRGKQEGDIWRFSEWGGPANQEVQRTELCGQGSLQRMELCSAGPASFPCFVFSPFVDLVVSCCLCFVFSFFVCFLACVFSRFCFFCCFILLCFLVCLFLLRSKSVDAEAACSHSRSWFQGLGVLGSRFQGLRFPISI